MVTMLCRGHFNIDSQGDSSDAPETHSGILTGFSEGEGDSSRGEEPPKETTGYSGYRVPGDFHFK